MTALVEYLGELRCESTHLKSGESIVSDAPVDNNGKGEAFSPTDTVATALASCMLTVMGIKARELKIELKGSTAKVNKIMASNPRRISGIEVELDMKASCDKRMQTILERVALTCPVLNSLHPEIEKDINFNWMS
ncbi:OsmC family protein [Nonlabens xiamenensis]|uniref:OsmC family protein n=1 Tax=Nonlabens xiamenensis TaxID=2341043 RepID=UPI000F607B4B|nr:OsmC family protein [Nonlabens xiamenensis]